MSATRREATAGPHDIGIEVDLAAVLLAALLLVHAVMLDDGVVEAQGDLDAWQRGHVRLQRCAVGGW